MFKKARTARVERAAHHACICARWKTVESSNATLLGIAFGRVDAASLATASFFSAISALRKYRGYIRTCTPRDTKTQIGYWLYLSYTHIRTHKSVAAHTVLLTVFVHLSNFPPSTSTSRSPPRGAPTLLKRNRRSCRNVE